MAQELLGEPNGAWGESALGLHPSAILAMTSKEPGGLHVVQAMVDLRKLQNEIEKNPSSAYGGLFAEAYEESWNEAWEPTEYQKARSERRENDNTNVATLDEEWHTCH